MRWKRKAARALLAAAVIAAVLALNALCVWWSASTCTPWGMCVVALSALAWALWLVLTA